MQLKIAILDILRNLKQITLIILIYLLFIMINDNRQQLFNRAFKFGYELGKDKQAMTSSIATGNTIPLLYRSTVQPNMD